MRAYKYNNNKTTELLYSSRTIKKEQLFPFYRRHAKFNAFSHK